jgi:riboflavin kinase / FMN adenylyltransferase
MAAARRDAEGRLTMRVIGGAERVELPASVDATVLTVGAFDGVHCGHQDVLARLTARASEVARASLLVTFDPHPREVIDPEGAPPLLTTREEKLALLESTGLDYVAIVPFTAELARWSATEFVDRMLIERFRLAELLVGHDHAFGRDRQGDLALLRSLGASRGFRVDPVPPVLTDSGEAVSSTVVRRAIASHDLESARALLGRWYSLRGAVVAGAARGRLLGFPTINVEVDSPRKLLPPDGVYAVQVVGSRGRFDGMMNLGGRPTFGEERRTLEVHMFDVDGDFYGDRVDIAFVARLRDTVRFPNPEALVAQLHRDADAARRALTALAEPGNLNGSAHVPPSTP